MSDDDLDMRELAEELARDKAKARPSKSTAPSTSAKEKPAAAKAKGGKAPDDSQDSFFASNDDDDDDDDDDDVEVDHEPEGGSKAAPPAGAKSKESVRFSTEAGTRPSSAQARGLEDSAANKRGAAPGSTSGGKGGLEDSAANGSQAKPISSFASLRQRYAADYDDDEAGAEASPFPNAGSIAPAAPSPEPPGTGLAATLDKEASLYLSGQEQSPSRAEVEAAEQEDFRLPTPSKAKRPPMLQTGVSHGSLTGAMGPPSEAVSDADSETEEQTKAVPTREAVVDTGGSVSMSAAQAAKMKAFEAHSQSRLKKSSTAKPITAADFAGQDALKALETTDKRTGLSLPSVLELFQTYDQDRTGAIHINEFKDMLTDLDGLKTAAKSSKAQPNKSTRPGEVEESPEDRYVRKEFERADLNGDELVSIDEFYIYFYSTLCFKFPMLRTGVNPGADLLNIYMKYCSFGKGSRSEQMDCSQFAKLCADAKLLNGKTVTKASCDIVWFRARAELENLESFKKKQDEYITSKMLYPQFLFALLYIAEKRRSGLQEVITRILREISPLPMPSCADYLVMKNDGSPEQLEEYLQRPRGLPVAPPNSMQIEMQQRMEKEALLAKSLRKGTFQAQKKPAAEEVREGDEEGVDADAEDADENAIPHGGAATKAPSTKAPLAEGRNVVCVDRRSQWGLEPKKLDLPEKFGVHALNDAECMLKVRALKPDELIMACRDVFHKFNKWQGGASKSNMDKVRFVKLIRDCQYITETPTGLTQNLLDMYFARVLPPAQNTINFMRFMDALRMVATKLRVSLNATIERIVLLREPLAE